MTRNRLRWVSHRERKALGAPEACKDSKLQGSYELFGV